MTITPQDSILNWSTTFVSSTVDSCISHDENCEKDVSVRMYTGKSATVFEKVKKDLEQHQDKFRSTFTAVRVNNFIDPSIQCRAVAINSNANETTVCGTPRSAKKHIAVSVLCVHRNTWSQSGWELNNSERKQHWLGRSRDMDEPPVQTTASTVLGDSTIQGGPGRPRTTCWLRSTVGGTPVFGRRTDTVLRSIFS